MDLKNKFNNLFKYNPDNDRNFLLPLSPNNLSQTEEKSINIYDNFDKNFEYLKVKYNLLINSDINTREFEISVANKSFKALLIFIDGMIDSESINNNILTPLMLKNSIKMNPSKPMKINNF